MEGAVQLLLLMAGAIVVWLNWSPRWEENLPRYLPAGAVAAAGILLQPNWFGWVLLLVGAYDVYITYQLQLVQHHPNPMGPITRWSKAALGVFSWISLKLASIAAQWKRYLGPLLARWLSALFTVDPEHRFRLSIATLSLAAISLIVAIPVFVVAETILVVTQGIAENFRELEAGWEHTFSTTFGDGLIAWLVTVERIAELWFLLLPLILATSFFCQRTFSATAERWLPSTTAILAVALLYALPYVVAVLLGDYQQPYID